MFSSLFKVGFSKNVERRIFSNQTKTLRTQNPTSEDFFCNLVV